MRLPGGDVGGEDVREPLGLFFSFTRGAKKEAAEGISRLRNTSVFCTKYEIQHGNTE
jgi:hypothetical protein